MWTLDRWDSPTVGPTSHRDVERAVELRARLGAPLLDAYGIEPDPQKTASYA
jgi:hypothetical protein